MKNITTFDEHLDERYGKIGTKKRLNFEIKAKAFAIGEVFRARRLCLGAVNPDERSVQNDVPRRRTYRRRFAESCLLDRRLQPRNSTRPNHRA